MPQLNTYHLYTVSSSIFSPAKNLVDFFDKIITLETALTIEQKIREAQTVNLPILNTLLENAQIRQRALEKIEGISTNPPQSLIVHGTPSDLSKQGTDLMQNIGNLISYVNTGENNTNPQLLLQEYQLCLAKSIHYEIQADNLWLYHRILNLSRTNTDEKQTEHLNDTAKKILIMSTICFALVAIGYYLWSTQDILTSSHEVIEKGSNANNEDHPLFVKKP